MWMGIRTGTGMEMGEERTDPSSDWRHSPENKEGLVGGTSTLQALTRPDSESLVVHLASIGDPDSTDATLRCLKVGLV